MASSEEVYGYANDVVATSVLVCYIGSPVCRQPGGKDMRQNLKQVLASVKMRGKTSVPMKFQDEAQLILDSFRDSKETGQAAEASEPTPPVKRPRGKSAAAGGGKAAKAKASPA